MEIVHQQLNAIIRDLHRQHMQPQSTPPLLISEPGAQTSSVLAELYMLLGRKHAETAMRMVDRGVVCLASGNRLLFRVASSSAPGSDTSYCMLPGRFCSTCTMQSHSGIGGPPCVHITAVLVAAAQSKCAVEELPAAEMATALFSIT